MEKEKINKIELEKNLNLIANTIKKVNFSEIENGNFILLWGTATILAGITDFSQIYFFNKLNLFYYNEISGWNFYIIAGIISIYMGIKTSIENKKKNFVQTHNQFATECKWIPYYILVSLFPFYISFFSVIDFYNINSINDLIDTSSYKFNHINYYSINSLLILFYSYPTFSTGRLYGNKSMIYGSILSFIMFLITFRTGVLIDQLLISLSGLVNWFIPGIILKREYLIYKKINNLKK